MSESAVTPTIRWHRPPLWLAIASIGLAVFCAVATIAAPRQVLGVDFWIKPLKFALSMVIFY